MDNFGVLKQEYPGERADTWYYEDIMQAHHLGIVWA